MREHKRLPKCVLTPAEAEKVIEMPDTQTVLGYRDRAIASQQIRRLQQSFVRPVCWPSVSCGIGVHKGL